jgi:serine protease
MDDNGHGTHAAGIAGAETNNRIGVAGTAPRCRIMPIKALDKVGNGNLFDVSLGIVWAVDHGARVLNLSLGGPNGKTLERAVQYALMKNVVVVSAMGNDGKNKKAYPAAFKGVISVGSIDFDKTRSSFSNYGNWISVVAPGSNILSTMPTYNTTMTEFEKEKEYDYLDGTSMATPMVAGIVGLMLSRNPNYTPAEVKSRLESTATDLGKKGYDIEYGYGLVNAAKAVL